MKPATAACLADIRTACKAPHAITANTFSHFHGRAATSAAFRIARAEGLIEVEATSVVGTPIYRPTGYSAAKVEAITATKH